ncbi:hypothetical protein DEO72_LG8g737 [Vigna unguiculata]|uniref:Uncharacterized protein n=1 Tax=Vigna unguiculata TaxID=3917 RepID=A0A4D6MQ40_VIGUN|nr:hypothetical protein DEO72_LG8g737 [Vigna unguiculata]
MASPYPPRRRSGSDHSRTPGRVPPSPGYASSELSTSTVSERQNPVVAAARSFTGMFAACFSPPESDNSRSLGDSEEFKSSSSTSSSVFPFLRRKALIQYLKFLVLFSC